MVGRIHSLTNVLKKQEFVNTDDYVKIPDVVFDEPVTELELELEDFGNDDDVAEEEIVEEQESKEEYVYPTREEIASYYQAELDEVCKQVSQKAYCDAIDKKSEELQACIQKVETKLEEMQQLQEQFLSQYSEELKYFALDIAQKLIQDKIDNDDMTLKKLVLQTVNNVKGISWLKVEISDELSNLVDFIKKELSKEEYHGVAEVVAGDFPKDTCRVITDNGATVATISVQADNLRGAFEEEENKP